MTRDKVLSLLGLAMRAGHIVSGEFSTENAIKARKAKLVIVAGDASENTKKLFKDKCTFYTVPICIYAKKETLGHAIGKEMRSSLAILDRNFANALSNILKMEEV